MKIGQREIGPGHPVYIIAEIGSNHAGSLALAVQLIHAAANAGADAAKFQYFRVGRFLVPRKDEESLRRYELPDEWLPVLKKACRDIGIDFLCTAFDLESLDVIDPFVAAHKVGSFEAGLWDLMRALEAKAKPIIASEGLREGPGIAGEGMPDLIRLRCVSTYPAPLDGYLKTHPSSHYWGVSDHTTDPTTVPCAAVALGACVVEKHFKNREAENLAAPDVGHSIDPTDFGLMVRAIRKTERVIR